MIYLEWIRITSEDLNLENCWVDETIDTITDFIFIGSAFIIYFMGIWVEFCVRINSKSVFKNCRRALKNKCKIRIVSIFTDIVKAVPFIHSFVRSFVSCWYATEFQLSESACPFLQNNKNDYLKTKSDLFHLSSDNLFKQAYLNYYRRDIAAGFKKMFNIRRLSVQFSRRGKCFYSETWWYIVGLTIMSNSLACYCSNVCL